jgi:hypothetical protein
MADGFVESGAFLAAVERALRDLRRRTGGLSSVEVVE